MIAFVDEILVDGALMHLLLCGHIEPAQNDEEGTPIEFRACRQCERKRTKEGGGSP